MKTSKDNYIKQYKQKIKLTYKKYLDKMFLIITIIIGKILQKYLMTSGVIINCASIY
jgi:hypothetical protein